MVSTKVIVKTKSHTFFILIYVKSMVIHPNLSEGPFITYLKSPILGFGLNNSK